MADLSQLSNEQLMALAGMTASAPKMPKRQTAFQDLQDELGGDFGNLSQVSAAIPSAPQNYASPPSMPSQIPMQQPDLSQMSNEELMAHAGISPSPQAQAPSVPQIQDLQAAFDAKKAGFIDRVKNDYDKRVASGQKAADAYVAGQQTLPETLLQHALNGGAGLGSDVIGEVLTSAGRGLNTITFGGAGKVADNVLGAIANSPVGDAARYVGNKYTVLEDQYPRAMRNVDAAGNALGIASAFIPAKEGVSAARAAGEAVDQIATNPVVIKAAKTVATTADKAYDLTKLAPEQQMLQDLGIRLTPGQRVGGARLAAENKATSIPIVGDAINSSYKRGLDDFNRSISDIVLSDIGQKLPKDVSIGHDAVAHVQSAISKSYDDVLSKMNGKVDNEFKNNMLKTQLEIEARLPKDKAKQAKSIINDLVKTRTTAQGTISGKDAKEIMSSLNTEAQSYLSSALPDDRKMGEFLMDARNHVSDMLQRNNPTQLSEQLAKTDASFAKFVRLQKAASSAGAANNGGIFTPAQFMSAVRSSDKSVRKGAVAKGEALMQDVATAAQKVLPNKYPDSGTTGRALAAGGVGALLTGGSSVLGPIPLIAGATATAAYTKPGQAVLRGLSKTIRKGK